MDRDIRRIAYHHRDVINDVQVRPIFQTEREKWDALIKQHHYLGLKSMVGKTLRYVAVFEDCWLALLGWQAAALKCKPRDQWVGWSPIIQYQRLHLIANNTRFLILPELKIKNLASRVLSLNLKRLAHDWQAIYGHPILLAETFVETTRFTGACYRAANWQVLGQTKGFSKSGNRYYFNNCPKQILVFPLTKFARKNLAALNPHPSWRWPMQSCALNNKQMEDLLLRLRRLPDVRKPRGIRHPYFTVLTIAIAALLGGEKTYASLAEWAGRLTQNRLKRLRARFDKKRDRFIPPSEPTIRRVLQSADVESVERCLGEWLRGIADDHAIAIDGKTLKGAKRDNGTQVHLLSAFLHNQGVTVSQLEVDEKTNEIPMIKPLLNDLDIQGTVVTADALHTQVKTARYIVEDKHADYLFIVKDNQKTLRENISVLRENDFSPSASNYR
jgi:hypothetical protein